jgi:hypothetical protein
VVAAQACILISIKDNCEKQFLHYHWRTCFELLDVDGSKTITVRERAPTRPVPPAPGPSRYPVNRIIREQPLPMTAEMPPLRVARARGGGRRAFASSSPSFSPLHANAGARVPQLRLHLQLQQETRDADLQGKLIYLYVSLQANQQAHI